MTPRPRHAPQPRSSSHALARAFRECGWVLGAAAAFSFLANLLMLAQPIYMLQVYDRVLATGHVSTLALLTLIIGAAILTFAALDAVRRVLLNRAGQWLETRVAPAVLAASMQSRLQGDPNGSESLRELEKIRSFIGGQGLATFFEAPWVPLFLALLFVLHPWLGMLGFGAAVAMGVLAALTEFGTRQLVRAGTQGQIRANTFVGAAIRNAEVVTAMGMQGAVADRYGSMQMGARQASGRADERLAILLACSKFVRAGAQIGVLGLGAFLVLRQELTPGGMIAGVIVLMRTLGPVEQAMSSWRSFSSARLAHQWIAELLEAFPAPSQRTQLPEPHGILSVENMSFWPAGSARPVLKNVSFEAEPGQALAVIGPSAAGKSTLCRMLIGIHSPSEGKVRLDGAELQAWNAAHLGRYIGYLPQDVELFSGTIRDNIARLQADATDAAVIEAATLAQAHDMIVRLPHAYDTRIGDGGRGLSGGQRQRIGLARAVFGQPRLIVLDEPNANLDQKGESALAAAIGNLKRQGATVIIVGHRPSTLHEVDRVLILQEGQVSALGPREEILAKLRKRPIEKEEGETTPPAAAPGYAEAAGDHA